MPKVTIAIPTRNRLGYLRLALNSALEQTLRDIEIVVSDNRCTDGTTEFLKTITDPRVRVLQQADDLTMVQNWNACVSEATAEYFLLLSDDDLLEPRALEAMVQAFGGKADSQRVGLVYCAGRMIDAEGKPLRSGMRAPLQEEASALILAFFNSKRETWPCSVLLRRTDLLPGYSSEFRVMTDAAAWIRPVCHYGVARFVDEELVSYRVHASLTGATPIAVWQEENSKAAELASSCLRKAGRWTPELQRQIDGAVRRLNMRIVLSLPMGAKDRRRRTVLRKYLPHLRQLANLYGVPRLGKQLLKMLLPRS